jgi:hypothetical protein
MKAGQLYILLGLTLLAACKKDDTPGPLSYKFSRALSFSPAGIRLDTTYTTNQISLKAETANSLQQVPTLYLSFGRDGDKDQTVLAIPVNKLQPGWVGSYTFVHSTGTGFPLTVAGEATANILLRYYPNHIAGLSGFYSAPGSFVITKYDAGRHLISGNFRYENNAFLALPPLANGVQGYELVLTGSFDNLTVTQ